MNKDIEAIKRDEKLGSCACLSCNGECFGCSDCHTDTALQPNQINKLMEKIEALDKD